MTFIWNYLSFTKTQIIPQWSIAAVLFFLKFICLWFQRKSDVFHTSLPSVFLTNIPPSMFHPTSNPMEHEGSLLMDVEGCFGPTAINSSPARSSLSGWWNHPDSAACHTTQEGLQTNASFMCLLYVLPVVQSENKYRATMCIKSHQVLQCQLGSRVGLRDYKDSK